MKKISRIYSSQPRFVIPGKIYQLFKPKPPLMFRLKKKKNKFSNTTNEVYYFKGLPNKIYSKSFFQEYISRFQSRKCHLKKRISESDIFLKIFFEGFIFKFSPLNFQTNLVFNKNQLLLRILKKFSKKIIFLNRLPSLLFSCYRKNYNIMTLLSQYNFLDFKKKMRFLKKHKI
mmetsp:Transcript_26573/g.53330  ORF Transcript_26573/g.53330 Transcript_26573/m.53330 type:complete len:173 (-) Transcript_26573:2649-3167(-)